MLLIVMARSDSQLMCELKLSTLLNTLRFTSDKQHPAPGHYDAQLATV